LSKCLNYLVSAWFCFCTGTPENSYGPNNPNNLISLKILKALITLITLRYAGEPSLWPSLHLCQGYKAACMGAVAVNEVAVVV
jgi:hypothetical protein